MLLAGQLLEIVFRSNVPRITREELLHQRRMPIAAICYRYESKPLFDPQERYEGKSGLLIHRQSHTNQ